MDEFKKLVWDYYAANGRHDLPWRALPHDIEQRFYSVVTSEIMLQQTPVQRVIPAFNKWMSRFPTIQTVADSSLRDVLRAWSGLGYNRRAQYIHKISQYVTSHGIPHTHEELTALPGIGINTAGALQAYVYNQPVVFIETNIRTVFIHHFFDSSHDVVHDKALIPIITEALDSTNPREWYWALMDYGSMLKKSVSSHRRSAHYKKQSPFKGSLREIRAHIIRQLTHAPQNYAELSAIISDDRLTIALQNLIADKLIKTDGTTYAINDEVIE